MASRALKDLHPTLVADVKNRLALWAKLYPKASQPFVTCTHRSNAEQDKLYASGRSRKGKILTNAQAGQSPHNQYPAMAYDIGFVKLGGQKMDWDPKLFHKFWNLTINEKIEWGGEFHNFKDLPHFELKNWKDNHG
jgi:peptidoglycan LD-endopeptidase CwlK